MHYKGSCHCRRVAFEVEGEIKQAMACNCSICQRKGSLLWFVPPEKFRLLTPASAVSTYTFNERSIKHRFCPDCGIHPFGEGTDLKGNPVIAVNIRCIEDIDLEAVPVQHYDGRSL